jgi:hypothetical protein
VKTYAVVVKPIPSTTTFNHHLVSNFPISHLKERANYQSSIMHSTTVALFLLFATRTVIAQNTTRDACPKAEYACIDVINSSQCLAQLVLQKLAPATREALAKCVEYEGAVTQIPGAAKVRSKERKDVDVEEKPADMYFMVESFVDVQDAIPPQSTLRLQSCSHRSVREGETPIVADHILS